MNDAQYWIDKLDLEPHIEGGYFKETYRSVENIDKHALPERFNGDHSFCTAIYFLLHSNDFSAFHRIKQDELWHFYMGDPLVTHGSWFGARLKARGSFALVGCTVAPGFDFADLEIAERDVLIKLFPEHQQIIEQLTR